MLVREMALSELPEVVVLHLEGLEFELANLNAIFPGKSVDYSGKEALIKLLTQVLNAGEGRIFVAAEGRAYGGYCLATKKVYPAENPRLCGCINGIYVRDAFKRQGWGCKLFTAATAWLKSQNVTYVELYHMLNDERATVFWRKMGFTPVQINCALRM